MKAYRLGYCLTLFLCITQQAAAQQADLRYSTCTDKLRNNDVNAYCSGYIQGYEAAVKRNGEPSTSSTTMSVTMLLDNPSGGTSSTEDKTILGGVEFNGPMVLSRTGLRKDAVVIDPKVQNFGNLNLELIDDQLTINAKHYESTPLDEWLKRNKNEVKPDEGALQQLFKSAEQRDNSNAVMFKLPATTK